MIVCAGDIMLDIFLLSQLQEAEQGSGIVLRGGGSAANTAVWLVRIGSPATFIGCVGVDSLAATLSRGLSETAVETRIRAVQGTETGAVLIQVEEDGTERVMRSSRGANMALAPDDIAVAATFPIACLHLTGYSFLGPFGLDLLAEAAKVAHGAGALLSLDPSSVGVIRRFGAEALLRSIAGNRVDILLPNAEEARELCGVDDPQAAAGALAEVAPLVFVKDGMQGALYDGGRVAAAPLRPIDPTGAGDAFNAGIIAAILRGETVEQACMVGNQSAAQVLMRFGGR